MDGVLEEGLLDGRWMELSHQPARESERERAMIQQSMEGRQEQRFGGNALYCSCLLIRLLARLVVRAPSIDG